MTSVPKGKTLDQGEKSTGPSYDMGATPEDEKEIP
jgi:hypothetical protein